jgi:uncharacterized protein
VRAVLDPNVIVSAVLTATGAPGSVLRAWLAGDFDLVVSPQLIGELARVLAYPKIRKRVSAGEADELLALLRDAGSLRPDPSDPPTLASEDPNDDYLIALAADASAVLVSGDHHLLDLRDRIPVYSPAEFLALLAQ